MRVAVVGASGFVGRHVLAELAARGVETIATSRNGAVAHAAPSQTTRALDLTTAGVDPWRRLGRPDVVIHLAWGGLPNYRSLHHHEGELPAQYAFLSGLVRGGLRRLLVVGTCLEYGLRDGALVETMATDPTTPYGFAKDALRRELAFLQREQSFALTWGRAFYLYGEGQAPGSLLSQLRAAVEAGRPSFPMSGGEQLRDFLPVADAARLIVDLALRDSDHGVVNLCSGAPTSVRSLVERVIAENGWRIDLDRGRYPYPDHEPFAFWGSREKLDRLLAAP